MSFIVGPPRKPADGLASTRSPKGAWLGMPVHASRIWEILLQPFPARHSIHLSSCAYHSTMSAEFDMPPQCETRQEPKIPSIN